jgi:hypothetical protein
METQKEAFVTTVMNFLITKEHKFFQSHGKHINVEMYHAISHLFPIDFLSGKSPIKTE